MKNFGRNFIIAFLMVLAIYQTGELWFGDFSNHNFFSFLGNNESAYSKGVAYTLDRLVINLGDNKVICRGSNIYESEYKNQFDNAVSVAILEGTLTENAGDVDWNNILSNRAIIYEYSCSFNGADLSGIFDVKSDNCAKIKSYDTIIISPRADNSFMRVIFYDSINRTSSYCELKSNSVIGKCYEVSSEFNYVDNEIYYISSVENGFDIFNGNKFLPQSESEVYNYQAIEPHYTMSDVVMIEKNANIFFDNTVIKNYTKNNGNYIFSDETTVVKYYNNNVLEYFNYDTKNGDDDGFSANYVAAINIIKQDEFITNEFYLDNYSYNDGQYIFNFNYKINDFPMLPSSEVKSATGMKSFIEVIASDGGVDRYRKYACRYTISDRITLSAKVDFISAIDGLYGDLFGANNENQPVDDITLAYIADNKGFGLKWIINIGDNNYTVGTDG